MAKKIFTDESLITLVDEIKAYTDSSVFTKANSSDLGDISTLNTKNNDNVVEAINELAQDGLSSGAGNTFAVSDTVEAPFSAYKLYGKSVQETVPGNQLFDADTDSVLNQSNGVVYTNSGDTITYSATGIYVPYRMRLDRNLFEAGKTYCIEADSVDGLLNVQLSGSADGVNKFQVKIINNTLLGIVTIPADLDMTVFDTFNDTTFLAVSFYVGDSSYAGETLTAKGVRVYCTDNPLTAWEPYTGGIPSPNPSFPQPIVSVGEKLVDGVVTDVGIGNDICGKNLIFHTPYTGNGLTSVINADGSLHITGTPTYNWWNAMSENSNAFLPIPSWKYIFSIEEPKTFVVGIKFYDASNAVHSYRLPIGSMSATIEIPDGYVFAYIFIEGLTAGSATDITIKPMLRLASVEDDTYVPYVEPQNHTLNRTLRAIPVTDAALANYTDESGQMWVADTIEEVGGKMCLVERVCHKKLTKDLPMSKSTTTAMDRYLVRVDNTAIPSGYAGYCSHAWLKSNSSVYLNSFRYDLNDGSTRFAIDYAEAGTTDLDTFKTFLDENDVYCGYILATPIITELSAEEVSAIESLHSYDGVTTVMSDAWAEVECATSNTTKTLLEIRNSLKDYYKKNEFDSIVLITVDDIDAICVFGPTLITFTIEGTSYQAEEGMNWVEWCDSDYNVDKYLAATGQPVIDITYINSVTYQGITVFGENTIIANAAYTLSPDQGADT